MSARDVLRSWVTAPEVNRALRALHREAEAVTASRPLVFVVTLGGAFRPETIPAGAWREVGGRPVAVVDLATARDVAAGRGADAIAAGLASPPPPGGCWCLALTADGDAVTCSVALAFGHGNRAGGDA